MINQFKLHNLGHLDQKPPTASVLRLFSGTSLGIMLISALVIALLHYLDFTIKMNIVKTKEMSRIHIGTESIGRQFRAITSDLKYLANSGYLLNFMDRHTQEDKEILASEFLAITRTKGIYDQTRYLDNTGMEIVRVNLNVDRPGIVPQGKLQNKSNRYYFKDTMGISCGEVFVSPLDLNIEKGQIEQPFKPMIRFGMPACDRQGRKQGVVLFNYLGARLLEHLRETLGAEESQPMLLNNGGFWLLSPASADEWGFMRNKDHRFQNRFPGIWEEIEKNKNGQVTTKAGIFTFQTIYPLEEGQISSTAVDDPSSMNREFIQARNYHWVLILHVPSRQILQQIEQRFSRGFFQFCLSLVFLLPLTWLFSKERIRAVTIANEAGNRTEKFARTVTAQLAEGLMVLDRDGQFQMINPKAEALLGWQENKLLNEKVERILPEFQQDKNKFDNIDWANNGIVKQAEPFYLRQKNGDEIPVSLLVAPMYNNGTMVGTIMTFQDITKRLAIEEKLKSMAAHDPLTGVKNRGELERLLVSELARCKRYGRSYSILMIDIDHFKKINDTHGHQRGDEVLKTMCHYIQTILRGSDVIGRYGGEEFIVILKVDP
ncbi:MAG: diguanylate cyclase [Desulfobacterium sp.]|nr:diguanylate cyclase [Desulfobacterium sp.]